MGYFTFSNEIFPLFIWDNISVELLLQPKNKSLFVSHLVIFRKDMKRRRVMFNRKTCPQLPTLSGFLKEKSGIL